MKTDILLKELNFRAMRSSGPGGQHVNKTSSKIELLFDLQNTAAFTELEKERLFHKLHSRLTKDSVLQLQCSESRSQHRNKAIVIERFLELIQQSLKTHKKRKQTRPSKNSIQKRLTSKKNHALKKKLRKKPPLN
jgi:ribosome-associated protein